MIGPDVKEEMDLYADLEVDEEDGWTMYFNPIEFNNLHKPLKFEQYRLTQDQLHSYAVDLTDIRQGFILEA